VIGGGGGIEGGGIEGWERWSGDGGVGRRMVGMGIAVRGGGYVLCAGTGRVPWRLSEDEC